MKKYKGSLKSIKMKYLLFIYAASLFILLPFRVYQLLAVTEIKTGFFVKGDITGYIMYGLVFGFVILFLALSFLSREVPSPRLPKGKNTPLGIASLVFSAALLYDCVEFIGKVYPGAGYSLKIVLTSLKTNIALNGGVLAVVRLIFAVASIVWFVSFAVGNLGGKASYAKYKILSLMPVCWSIARVLSYLSSALNYLRVSDLLFEIVMLAFLILFFMTAARISTGEFAVDTMWGIYGYGFSAAVFAALITVPRVIVTALGRENALNFSFEPADFGALIFVITYIFASFGIGFDGSAKERKLISEIALPEDGVVVRKGDNRRLSENTERFSINEKALETHGIFKVQEETVEIIREDPVEKTDALKLTEEIGVFEPAAAESFADAEEKPAEESTAAHEEAFAEEHGESLDGGEAPESGKFEKRKKRSLFKKKKSRRAYVEESTGEEVLNEEEPAEEVEEAKESDEYSLQISKEQSTEGDSDDDEGVSLLLDEYAAEADSEGDGFEGAEEADEEFGDVESDEADDSADVSVDDDKEEAREAFSPEGESFFADSGDALEETDGEPEEIEEPVKRKKHGLFKKKKSRREYVEEESAEEEAFEEVPAEEEKAAPEIAFEEEPQESFDGETEESSAFEEPEKRKKRSGFFKKKKEYDEADDDEEPISAVSLKDLKARKKK